MTGWDSITPLNPARLAPEAGRNPYSKSLPAEMPREDLRLNPVRLRARARSGRRGGLGLRLGGGGVGRRRRSLSIEPLRFGGIRRLSRRSWSSDFGFLLTRSEKRGRGEDAEYFFHGL